MRRAKGLEWTLLAVVLAVPAVLFSRWNSGLKSAAPPATRPARAAAVAAPKGEAPEPPPRNEPAKPAPEPPPRKEEPVLLAMRDPMLSPYDKMELIRRDTARRFTDPTPPPPPPPPKIPVDAGIRLEGVILADDQPRRAIVNGTVLEEGETIKGVKVLKVDSRGVLFGKGAKRFTKRLGEE